MADALRTVLCVILLNGGVKAGDFTVSLSRLSTLYLPYTYNESTPVYQLGEAAVEQIAYDAQEKILYTVGSTLHAIDVSDIYNMTVLYHMSVTNKEFTDIELCGDHVFTAFDNKIDRMKGEVAVFQKFTQASGTMKQIYSIPVGAVPDMVYPTHDCSKLLVAVEGEAFGVGKNFRDPPGAVAIISFPHSIRPGHRPFSTKILNFTEFNGRVKQLEKTGVRFVYKENNNTFSNDVEPEYIALSDDGHKAYIALQENNAIAEVDLFNEEITTVRGLGFKPWNTMTFDPSDRDNGINMAPWPVYGMYLPDVIMFIHWNGTDYLLTANEGDEKDYGHLNKWSEKKRGKSFVTDDLLSPSIDSNLRAALQDKGKLGRLYFTTENGRNIDGKFDSLYTFGGRGFSIRRADNFQLVYDSGDDMEKKHAQHRPALFNSEMSAETRTPLDDFDSRSDNKGPETESLTVGKIRGKLLIFVGNERPGTIAVYSVKHDLAHPRFEYLYDGVGDVNTTWEDLYTERRLSDIDPEDIRFVSSQDSPTQEPLLFVAGSVTGTISVLKIDIHETMEPTKKPSTNNSCKIGSCGLVLLLNAFIARIKSHLYR